MKGGDGEGIEDVLELLGGLGVQRSVVPVEDHILEVAVGTSVCSWPTLRISVWSAAPVR